MLIVAPILNIVDPKKVYVVCTDACLQGLGGVLMQENYVEVYESRKLKQNERNYVVYELELVVVIYALKMWRQYLLGKMIMLVTDHNSLKYIFSINLI